MVLEVLFGKKQERKRSRYGVLWVPIMDVKRLVIDGQEILVRRVINVTPDEIIYEDVFGNIKSLKRKKPEENVKKEEKHGLPLVVF